MARHYLDHASTSPLRPAAAHEMVRWLAGAGDDVVAADPGRIHAEGMRARVAIEESREAIATFVGARSRELVFTSGATESIASAVWGAAARGTHLVVPLVEHSAVRAAAQALIDAGTHEVTWIGVDAAGRVDPEAVAAAVRPETCLVSIQSGNHEVGTRQPVEAIVSVGAAANEGRAIGQELLVHVDATAAVGHIPVDFRALGADLLSFGAHKFGGPPGIGGLVIARGLRLRPLLRGGDQERARRAGMENLPAIRGLAAAVDALASDDTLAAEATRARAHTARVLDAVGSLTGVVIYGNPDDRLPHIVSLGIADIEPQAVLLGLDQAGIAAHSGSACSSEALEPSPVLEAMGVDAHHSLRVSVGWSTTDADIDALLDALPTVIARLRALRT